MTKTSAGTDFLLKRPPRTNNVVVVATLWHAPPLPAFQKWVWSHEKDNIEYLEMDNEITQGILIKWKKYPNVKIFISAKSGLTSAYSKSEKDAHEAVQYTLQVLSHFASDSPVYATRIKELSSRSG